MNVEKAHDEVIVIPENKNSEGSSSSSGDKVDVIDKNETSNIKVDVVDTNKCDETSEVTSNVIPEGKNEEVLQECESTADVNQMTKTPEQQLSDAPELAFQVVDDQDDGTVEQAGDEPAKEEPAVQLDEAPLDETQPVVQSPREDRISNAVRLELERLRFEKAAKRRFQLDLEIEHSLTLLCFLERPHGNGGTAGSQPAVTYAASVPVIEYVSPIFPVYAATVPVNECATRVLLMRQEC